jgi:hypothetical protein
LGYHTSTSRNSTNEYYDISYTFFRERARRPKIDVSLARTENGRVGFQVTVRRSGIRNPYVECNGTEYLFEKQNHDDENVFLQVNTYYSSYPFAIKQDHSKGAYIIQLNRKLREVEKFDTTIQASIHIRGEGFEMEKDYVLTSNLLDLRTKRLNSNELIRLENVTFSLEEIKEPSLWRRFLSSFSVTRSRIAK